VKNINSNNNKPFSRCGSACTRRPRHNRARSACTCGGSARIPSLPWRSRGSGAAVGSGCLSPPLLLLPSPSLPSTSTSSMFGFASSLRSCRRLAGPLPVQRQSENASPSPARSVWNKRLRCRGVRNGGAKEGTKKKHWNVEKKKVGGRRTLALFSLSLSFSHLIRCRRSRRSESVCRRKTATPVAT